MKKLTSLVLVLLMIASLAVTVFANADGNKWGDIPLYKGEIKLDGKIDEIYLQGLAVKIDKRTDGTTGGATGTAYLLWGNNKLYLAVDVVDPKIVPVDASQSVFKNEAIEFIVDFLNNGNTKNACKIMVGAQDNRMEIRYGATETYAKSVSVMSDKGYVIEVVCDLSQQTFTSPKAGENYGINIVIDDVTEPGVVTAVSPTHKNSPATNEAKKYDYATLSDKEVKVEAATTKPAETTKPAAQTQKPASSTTAPATFDAFAVIAVVAAASLGGVVVSKKRK